MMKMKSVQDKVFDIFNIIFMLLVLVVMLYPLWFTIIVSFSDPLAVGGGKVWILPVDPTLEAYQNVFKSDMIWIGYRNTIFYTVLGTAFNIFLTIPAAYVLSKKTLVGRNALSWIFLFTMYFGGGLVPTYLLFKNLSLVNTPWVLIISGGLSVYNMIVTRIFFQTSIPEEIYESARIDGASNFRMFFQIALPLSKSIIAVMTLFYAVSRWNSYFSALVYTTKEELAPLQLVLRRILILNEDMIKEITSGSISGDQMMDALRKAQMAETMKYSLIFIASAPLLVAYPFVQKYFVKGVMIGSLKG
ncbi:MAG: carbohydrate ABC transporter permease [Clostridiales bacterium]|jgi:putative aldouronate transport system permease protein|nr:carbohydrate ABC transporter permease [Clostridiales bacterium]